VKRFLHWPGHTWLALPARLYLGWVFILASAYKIAHPGSFALDIATYDILPLPLVNPMAIVLPWVEIAVGIMLVVGFRVRGASIAVTGMMIVFIVALLLALAKGLNMSCGCFASQGAVENDPMSYLTVLRDVAWLLLAAYIVLVDCNAIGVDRLLAARRRGHE
jgi:putative oxidoreductase